VSDNQRLPLLERGELESSYAPDPALQLAASRRIADDFRKQADALPDCGARDRKLAQARLFENGGYEPIDASEYVAALRDMAAAFWRWADEVTDADEDHTLSVSRTPYSEREFLRTQAERYERAALSAEGES
jgi:hypothetical protein